MPDNGYKIWQKEYYSKNREKILDYVKNKQAEYRRIVYGYYGQECNCCGENNPFFLTLDHVNNDGNKHKNKSGHKLTGAALCRWIIDNNFPETIQVLCMNCNHGKRMNDGVCPHIALNKE